MNKFWFGAITFVAMLTLVGCGSNAQPATSSTSAGSAYTSQVLATDYDGALSAADQLMLGAIQLEETEQAITAKQAADLLNLLQALQSGALKSDVERNAVYAQIEAKLSPAQLQAIAAMQLTQQDLATWMESQGPEGAPGQAGPGPQGTPGAPPQFGGGTPSPDMATRRAQFDTMSEEERAAMRATAQAGGMPGAPGGGAGGGRPSTGGSQPGARQDSFLLNALIRLLTMKTGGPGAN